MLCNRTRKLLFAICPFYYAQTRMRSAILRNHFNDLSISFSSEYPSRNICRSNPLQRKYSLQRVMVPLRPHCNLVMVHLGIEHESVVLAVHNLLPLGNHDKIYTVFLAQILPYSVPRRHKKPTLYWLKVAAGTLSPPNMTKSNASPASRCLLEFNLGSTSAIFAFPGW